MPLEVVCKAIGCIVAALAILFQALHDNPVEIAAERGGKLCRVRVAALCDRREFVADERFYPRRGSRRIDLANDAPDFIHARLRHGRGVDRRVSGEQFVKQHAEAVDVAPRVDVERGQPRLLGRHVEWRAHHMLELGEEGRVREPTLRGLGHAEINDLRHRLTVVDRHEDVRWLEVAVNNAFLVRVLHRLADVDEQREARWR